MSDTVPSVDARVDPFIDARASAVIANQVARDVLHHLEDAEAAGSVAVLQAVSGSFPEHPLDTAVRDLAVATLAASRAAERAWRGGSADHATAAGEAARQAARALRLAQSVAVSPALRGDVHERVRVVHAVASTAFAAADLVRRSPGQRDAAPASVTFPPSWRHLIGILSHAIDECEAGAGEEDERRHLLDAACAARDGAEAVRRACDRAAGGTLAPAPARFARVAALASAYAGCAALVPLRGG